MNIIFGFLKTLGVWCAIGIYIIHSSIGSFFIKDSKKRLAFFMYTTSWYSALILRLLGFTINVHGKSNFISNNGLLVVSNHLSYLDILVLASIRPMLFITSVEMKETFFLGMMTRFGGSLYVERRNTRNIKNEINNIAAAIKDGFTVALFPEATSSDGTTVLPFHASLFQPARTAQASIVPVCIRYRQINSTDIDYRNRDSVYWYGAMKFLPHFLRLPFLRTVCVEITIMDSIKDSQTLTRKEISESAFNKIAAQYLTTGFTMS